MTWGMILRRIPTSPHALISAVVSRKPTLNSFFHIVYGFSTPNHQPYSAKWASMTHSPISSLLGNLWLLIRLSGLSARETITWSSIRLASGMEDHVICSAQRHLHHEPPTIISLANYPFDPTTANSTTWPNSPRPSPRLTSPPKNQKNQTRSPKILPHFSDKPRLSLH